jgi:hypothetical protein
VPDTNPAGANPPGSADVVIVGAGPAGLAMASALWHRGVRDVVLLDRCGRPCGRFFDRVDVLRQRVLRSPYEHHPGAEGYRDCELLDFARLYWGVLTPVERREIRMAQAGHRSVVPVDVFEAFCRHVAAIHGVSGRTWRVAVQELVPGPTSVAIRGQDFEMTARFVVLCTGEERAAMPAGWRAGVPLPGPAGPVSYWDEPVPPDAGQLVIVGAGLTAAHLVANAITGGRRVAWVIRAASERYQCSDVNAAFFRAEGRARFDGTGWPSRLAQMRAERRASIMFEFRPLLRSAEDSGQLTVYRGREVAGLADADGAPGLRLADGEVVAGDHVVLALGTRPSAGPDLLRPHVTGARDGWPDLEEDTLAFRRAPRVLVVGAAAGMVLGPAARNIDGHRVAAARVAAAITVGLRQPARDKVAAHA